MLTLAETLDMYLKQSYDFVIEMSSFIISAVSQFHHEIVSDIHKHKLILVEENKAAFTISLFCDTNVTEQKS